MSVNLHVSWPLSLLMLMGVGAAADGPAVPSGPAPPQAAAPSSQGGSGFLPCAVAFLGVKLSPKDAKGVTVALDNIQLKFTKVGDRYEMEPIGIPGPKPANYKAPTVNVGETDVTYDTGPMAVTWRMNQVFDLPPDWTTVECMSGKGMMAQGVFTIVRENGVVTLTSKVPGSRLETWVFRPY